MKYDRIIFVCTGNTCRSPMAEMIMKQKLKVSGADSVPIVISRGINAYNGTPISRQASEVLAAHGLSHNGFVALQLREQDLTGGSVLILTMTARHADAVRSMIRMGQQGRLGAKQSCEVYTLAEYVGEPRDVSDPFGQPVYVYEECFRQLERMIEKAVVRILA